MKIGRNDPCHCGSGTKYKKCCEPKDAAARTAALAAQAATRSANAEAEKAASTSRPAADRTANSLKAKAKANVPKPNAGPKTSMGIRRRAV